VYINQDDGQEILLRGEVDIVVEYSGDIFQIIDECDCDDYAFVIPEEGANFWVDNLVIPAGASNVPSWRTSSSTTCWTRRSRPTSPTTRPTAAPTAPRSRPHRRRPARRPGHLPGRRDRGAAVPDRAGRTLEQLYNDAWDEVKIFIGR
jgi:spermidine/putrescine transport system substrate-binding protein